MNLSTYNPERLRFLKIKYDGEEMTLKYERMNHQGQWDEYSLKSRLEPHKDFINVMDRLADVQMTMCELLTGDFDETHYGQELNRHDIRGVSLSYGEDEGGNVVTGVTITSLRRLDRSNAPLTLNTPHKFDRTHTDHGDEEILMDSDDMDVVMKLCQQALSYIEGKRKQLDMFAEAEQEEEVAA